MEDKVINPLTDDLDWPEYDSAKLAEDVDDEEYDPMSFDYKPVTVSEAEQKAAEKAFTDELTNGPEVPVRYGNGAVYRKKIGSFDLENMHKAYDQWFIDNKLLDIFRADGKFKNKGTYVRYKSMNSKEPAVKALKAMYTAQFSTEMPFTSDKRAEEAKKKAEEEAQKILEQKGEQAKESLKVELDKMTGEIKDSAEYKDLVAQYPEDMQKDIDVHGTVIRAVPRQAGGAIIAVAELSITFTGALYSSVPIAYSNRFEIDPDDPSTFAGLLEAMRRETKVLIQRMSKASMPMLFALKNYEMFVKKHPEHELLKKDITLGYFNGKNRKVAWTKVVEMRFSYIDTDGQLCWGTKNGLLLVNSEDPTDKANILGSSWNLMACTRDVDRSSGRCWSSETWEEYFNRPGNPDIFRRLHVHTSAQAGSNGGTEVRLLADVPSPYDKYFNSGSRCMWEEDSSD